MAYPAAWFALQFRCAERGAALLALSPDEAILRFTNCYLQLGLGSGFDPAAPRWVAFLRGLRAAPDPATWAAAHCRDPAGPLASGPFGPFRYDWVPDEGRIRLHFANTERAGAGPLSAARYPERRAELRALFAEVAARYPEARTVRGNSWLHGIAAYRRLFPPEYGASAILAPPEEELPYLALWGQFLDHIGAIKAELAATFLDRLARARTLGEIAAAFPHPVYEVECAIAHFFTFYGVGPPVARAGLPDRGEA